MSGELSVGQTIGDYEILGILGEGGMGKVYRVHNRISRRVEAMKILLPDLRAEPDAATRFLREIQISASLDHPSIGAMRTALQVENQLIMIMEFVDGATLDNLMKRDRLPPEKIIDYLCQALVALSYAHSRGVIHRDIKPANMMLTSGEKLKLMDFGIAKVANDPRLTQTGLLVGSVPYMSPEQIECKDLDPRADLYSLGVTLYELATGQRPFVADNAYEIMRAHLKETPRLPSELDPSLPPGLDEVVMVALAKDPAQRFQTADAFINALSSLLTVPQRQWQAPTPSTQTNSSAASSKTGSRFWYMLSGSAATIAVVLAGAVGIPKYMRTEATSKPANNARIAHQPRSLGRSPSLAVPSGGRAAAPGSAPRSGLVSAPRREADDHAPQSAVPEKSKSETARSGKSPVLARAAQADSSPTASAQVPQPPASQSTPQANAALAELRERANLIALRVIPVRASLKNLRQQEASYGFGLRMDLATAEQRMVYQLDQAELNLRQGDAAVAKRRLDAAEQELDTIEDSLGSPVRRH